VDDLVALRKLVPELDEVVERRYSLLKIVRNEAPIGRRFLAALLGSSERVTRTELEILREQGLIVTSSVGVELTAQGEQVLTLLQNVVREFHDIEYVERRLEKALGVGKMIVVPGDLDSNPSGKRDLALAAARYLKGVLREGHVLAVSGGTTLAKVAECFSGQDVPKNVTVVPIRGGLGEDAKIHANSIAVTLADNIGGSYRQLHAPEDVLPCYLEQILSEPRIREVIALGRRADILVHGIGTAEEMARRRGFDDASLMELIADGAVGEAFGCYFDAHGNIVRNTTSVGLRLEDLERIPLVVTVGGGHSKAWAVMAVLSRGYCDVCITDEGVARRLMSLKEIT
jgi:central glycolytic genes regulator